MSTPQNEPRQFWISWKDAKRFVADRIFMFEPHSDLKLQEIEHVIEYSAYEQAQALIQELEIRWQQHSEEYYKRMNEFNETHGDKIQLQQRVKELEAQLDEAIKWKNAFMDTSDELCDKRDELQRKVAELEASLKIMRGADKDNVKLADMLFKLEAENAELKKKIDEQCIYRDMYKDKWKNACDRNAELDKENARLRQALEFYSKQSSYEYVEHSDGLEGRGDFPVMKDWGNIARSALGKGK